MLENIREIFRLYGGWSAVKTSTYARWALLLSVFLWRDAWSGRWSETITDYLPPILGFSFAALAIMTAIGDDEFRRLMSKVDTIRKGQSDLAIVTANFSWFIVIQITAVVLALIFAAKPLPDICSFTTDLKYCIEGRRLVNFLIGCLGNFLLLYSLILILSAVYQMMQIFRLYLSSVSK